MILIFLFSLLFSASAFLAVGGFTPFMQKYESLPEPIISLANQSVQCLPYERKKYAFSLIQGLDGPFPWPGMIFGLTVSAVWYLCTDQV